MTFLWGVGDAKKSDFSNFYCLPDMLALMGLRPTQGDENTFGPETTLHIKIALSFVIHSEAGGLQFCGPFLGLFFDRAQRSGEICGFCSLPQPHYFTRTVGSTDNPGRNK
jgi:hypothetical protein